MAWRLKEVHRSHYRLIYATDPAPIKLLKSNICRDKPYFCLCAIYGNVIAKEISTKKGKRPHPLLKYD